MFSSIECVPFPSPVHFLNFESCIGGWVVWIVFISGVSWLWALTMNKIFGHSTYWKKTFTFSSPPLRQQEINSKSRASFKRKPSNERLLDSIDDYVLKSAIKFLSVKDVLVLGTVSKSLNELTQCPSIWSAFERQLFCYPFPEHILSLRPINFSSFRDLFYYKLIVYHKVLASKTEVVLIHSNVYDVTNFISEHPGGDPVMRDKLGKDASAIFDLANHSYDAFTIMENLCIWSPLEVLGGKGIPFRARLIKKELSEFLT